MTHILNIETDKTFGSGDDGTLHYVTARSNIKIPPDSTHKFKINDWIDVFRDTTDNVSVTPASTAIKLSSIGRNIRKLGFARFMKIADNKWIGWGDLST